MKKQLLTAALLLGLLLYGCGNSEDDILDIAEDANVWEDDSAYEEADPNYENYTYEEESEEDMETSTDADTIEDESWDEETSEETSYILMTLQANGKILAKLDSAKHSREQLLYLTETTAIFIAPAILMLFILMGIDMF